MTRIAWMGLMGLASMGLVASGWAENSVEVGESLISGLERERPRLMIDRAQVEGWRGGSLDTEPLKGWAVDAMEAADELLTASAIRYPGEGSIQTGARELIKRVYTLGFAFLSTEDGRYAERLWEDLRVAGELESWRAGVQFLDTAEMMHATEIAYDWLHDEWTPEQREFLRGALVRNGLEAARDAYDGKLPGYPGWAATNNWNFVCNASVIAAVAAILPAELDLGRELVGRAWELMRPAILAYGEDGGWGEGVTYWSYSTRYLGLLMNTLKPELMAEVGLGEINPGLAKTGYFPIYLTGPTGMPFDFADSEYGPTRSSELFDLARIFETPAFANFQIERARGDVADILALSALGPLKSAEPLPLDRFFRGVGVVSARSSWDDPNANFFALKAGDGGANHSHLDLGSFVFEALGRRWIYEVDKESYGAPGYFDVGPKARRWSYYPARAEGHNTIVMNPSPAPDQYFRAKTKMKAFETSLGEALTVVDLTDAYAPTGVRVWRGMRLTDSRNRLFLRDEVRLKKPGEVVWSVHVRDPVEVSADGQTATLLSDKRRLRLRLVDPAGARFEVMAAEPLVEIPGFEQRPNPTLRKIVVRVKDVKETVIGVWFEPMIAGEEPLFGDDPEFGVLADWKLEPAEETLVSKILVDGVEVPGFDPAKFTYTVGQSRPAKTIRTEGAVAESEGRVVGSTFPQQLSVRAGGLYRVIVEEREAPPEVLTEVPPPREVRVKGEAQEGNEAERAFDGAIKTRWSAEGRDVSLEIDLGDPMRVSGLGVAMMEGDARRAEYSLEASDDGQNWAMVLDRRRTSGQTEDVEVARFDAPVEARYFRFRGHGNSVNDWNSVSEIVFVPASGE